MIGEKMKGYTSKETETIIFTLISSQTSRTKQKSANDVC